ncbi:Crp/Fnr family transcriptional regulator [Pararhodonellum marinum]|uniref:Crp/Fnr family transcriptional regulator n=1 Tax=Pararhodonellum marinum TaxID=2755358 RepID=UPI00188E31F3|nr:Crp/Fnr family transcriptional regulator [Pararhodonellum marinum]
MPILDLVDQIYPLPKSAKAAFAEIIHYRVLEKGDFVLKQGQVCHNLVFVEKGTLRSFYFKEAKDVTVSFSMMGEFSTSMYSFVSRKPSYESIEAIENCYLAYISHHDLFNKIEQHPSLERLYRMILEQYYILLEEQMIFSKFKSAKERYVELLAGKPKLIQVATVGQIASYLDMSIETLSRVRHGLL